MAGLFPVISGVFLGLPLSSAPPTGLFVLFDNPGVRKERGQGGEVPPLRWDQFVNDEPGACIGPVDTETCLTQCF